MSISNLFIDGSFLKGSLSSTAVVQIRAILSSESHLQQDNMKAGVAGPRCGVAGCHCSAVTSELGESINVLLKYSGGNQSLQGADFRAISSLALMGVGMKFAIFPRKLVPVSHGTLPTPRPAALLH